MTMHAMYQIFIQTKSLFGAIAETLDGTDCRVVFQRFKGPKGGPGFKVADLDKAPWKEYIDSGYSLLFITKGAVPKHETDWKFLDREQARLIEITGGRTLKKDLEVATLRKVAKQTEMDGLFKKLTKTLDGMSDKGVLVNGNPYPAIRVEKNLKGLGLYLDIETKTLHATPM